MDGCGEERGKWIVGALGSLEMEKMSKAQEIQKKKRGGSENEILQRKVGIIQQRLEPSEELGKLHKMRQGVEKADDLRDWALSIDRLPTGILR